VTPRRRLADRALGILAAPLFLIDLFFGRYFEERSGLRRARERAKETEERRLKVIKGGLQ
jgi:hypothetical protein